MRRRLGIFGTAFALVALLLAGMYATSPTAARAASTMVGPKQYYLALGDSLAYGYQPNYDWSDGYTQDFQNHIGTTSYENYACNGETSTTMINGGCPYWYTNHIWYFEPQLTAAVGFIQAHPGQVSPVTLDMGGNDMLPDIDPSTCTISASWTTDLATLHSNLVNTILPQLTSALTISGHRTGDLMMMNYYDPFINMCPNTLSYVKQLNNELAADAALFNIPLVNTYAAFGGDGQGANICDYTWICSYFSDIHATNTGYQVIANAFAAMAGY